MAELWHRVVNGKSLREIESKLEEKYREEVRLRDEALLKANFNHEKEIAQKDHEMLVRERQLRAEIDRQELANAADIQRLHERYAIDMSRTNEAHTKELRDVYGRIDVLNTTAEREKRQADEKMKRIVTDHANKLEEIKQAHSEERSQLVQAQNAREEQLISDHRERTHRLQEEVQHINAALLTRDDEIYYGMVFATSGLPRNPDDKIRTQFLEIQQMVESLGRLQWRPNQPYWTEEMLQTIGAQHSQRLLRKAILQDLIWTLLFSFLFCTPFRVFGEQGKLLESEWREQCGRESSEDDNNWPAASVKTERWRYMTIKECREALTKPVPSQWDPRASLKKGFKGSLDSLVTTMTTELGDIVDLAAPDLQLIERLSKRAATTWLEFQMHRCRIVVILTGSAARSTAEKVALLQGSSLMLNISPMIGRHGNVNGVDLESFTMIANCAGDTLTIP